MSLLVAGQLNRAIYRWAWNPRNIGPWTPPLEKAPPRHVTDYVPVVGWFGLEREAALHGPWYWIRPMLIEVAFAVGMVALYVYETGGALHGVVMPAPILLGEIHWEYLSHYALISLMVIATFIDIDEKMIPDMITIPGTIIGLALATCAPQMFFPHGREQVFLTTPNEWPASLDTIQGLAIGLAAFVAWCYALLPKTLWWRSGFARGMQFLAASVVRGLTRDVQGRRMGWMAIIGSAAIIAIWKWDAGGEHWQGLLTSLVGVAGGGALVWAIRVAASVSLRKEALGFGDVTLMAMIGSYFGWQATVMTFFLAPFAGVVIAVVQYLFLRRAEIAFGPFLCLAALGMILFWDSTWVRWGAVFVLGWIVPAILIGCIGVMAVMLVAWRKLSGGYDD